MNSVLSLLIRWNNMMIQKARSFLTQCIRVFKITRKPSKEEYQMIVKMSGIGIAIIGIMGFLITYLKELLF
ncbi:protein translocase SEC61 complex subunit gamma [Candidatus Woesearchaeota archaeon]|nr:protein translocase SEC61 complex subunit gamma [Candidatus Woesearchaeota archaeon]